MADVLIRNLDDETLRRIDEAAAREGVSRSAYLRDQLKRLAPEPERHTTRADLQRVAEIFVDVTDEAVMRSAWA